MTTKTKVEPVYYWHERVLKVCANGEEHFSDELREKSEYTCSRCGKELAPREMIIAGQEWNICINCWMEENARRLREARNDGARTGKTLNMIGRENNEYRANEYT